MPILKEGCLRTVLLMRKTSVSRHPFFKGVGRSSFFCCIGTFVKFKLDAGKLHIVRLNYQYVSHIISFTYYMANILSMVLKQDTLGFLLADVSRLMRRQFNQHIEGSSLTLAQARALVYVSRHEGIRQSKLADMLEILPITVTRLIDQLVDVGLVDRRADPLDRRAYQIFLTAQAPTHLTAIEQVIELIQGEALNGLAEEQVDVVIAALKKMRLNLGCTLKGRKEDVLKETDNE